MYVIWNLDTEQHPGWMIQRHLTMAGYWTQMIRTDTVWPPMCPCRWTSMCNCSGRCILVCKCASNSIHRHAKKCVAVAVMKSSVKTLIEWSIVFLTTKVVQCRGTGFLSRVSTSMLTRHYVCQLGSSIVAKRVDVSAYFLQRGNPTILVLNICEIPTELPLYGSDEYR